MASILFLDGLACLVPVPEEVQAIHTVATYFQGKGHRAEVIGDRELTNPAQVKQRICADLPDVLVTDMLGFRDGFGLLQELERQHPR